MVEQFSSRDLSLDSSLGEMVEDAHHGYYGPIFMDISSNWFTGITMLYSFVAGCAFLLANIGWVGAKLQG